MIMATKKVNGAKASKSGKSVEFAFDLLTKESEKLLAEFIVKKCEQMECSEVEKAAILQTIKEALAEAEPIQRSKTLAFLLEKFPEECLSGQHFVVDGIEVDVQQIPTYDYQGDKKLMQLMKSLRYWKDQLGKAEKKVKTYQEFLIASGKAVLTHTNYRLRIHRK